MVELKLDGVTYYVGNVNGLRTFYMPHPRDGWHLAGWLREDGSYHTCKTEELMQRLLSAWRNLAN